MDFVLSNGVVVLIDSEDYELVRNYKWYISGSGYVESFSNGNNKKKRILLHRLILNAPTHLETDHINRNPLDNRKSNIRLCTHSQNMCNRTNKRNTTGYRGVSQYANRWVAYICHNKKRMNLGSFIEIKDAARAYNRAAMKYHGEFAHLNEGI